MSRTITAAPGYEALLAVFQQAHDHAATGKGFERHANDLPFEKQRMLSITRELKSPRGLAYQVIKKISEGLDLPTHKQQVAELLGAINYAAGIVIYLNELEAAKVPAEQAGEPEAFVAGEPARDSAYEELAKGLEGVEYSSVFRKYLAEIFGIPAELFDKLGPCDNPNCATCHPETAESTKVLTPESEIPDLDVIDPRRFQCRQKRDGQGPDEGWANCGTAASYRLLRQSSYGEVRIISADQLQEDIRRDARPKANVTVVEIKADATGALSGIADMLATMTATRDKKNLH